MRGKEVGGPTCGVWFEGKPQRRRWARKLPVWLQSQPHVYMAFTCDIYLITKLQYINDSLIVLYIHTMWYLQTRLQSTAPQRDDFVSFRAHPRPASGKRRVSHPGSLRKRPTAEERTEEGETSRKAGGCPAKQEPLSMLSYTSIYRIYIYIMCNSFMMFYVQFREGRAIPNISCFRWQQQPKPGTTKFTNKLSPCGVS